VTAKPDYAVREQICVEDVPGVNEIERLRLQCRCAKTLYKGTAGEGTMA